VGFASPHAANIFILMILYDFFCCLHNFVILRLEFIQMYTNIV
jgi:hypothetical protein